MAANRTDGNDKKFLFFQVLIETERNDKKESNQTNKTDKSLELLLPVYILSAANNMICNCESILKTLLCVCGCVCVVFLLLLLFIR